MKSNSSTVPSVRLARTRRGWPQTALLAATLVCLEGLPAMASEGHASAESRHTYAIAPGSLAGALNRLAETGRRLRQRRQPLAARPASLRKRMGEI